MAQQFVTTSGTLVIPGSYSSYEVAQQNSGAAQTGVIMLLGESEAGPDHTLEDDIALNGYGPDQEAAVIAKYKSGPLVDAFRAVVAAANDAQVQGAPSRIYPVKTNASTRASVSMTRSGLTAYHTLADRSYGDLGNNLYFSISDEVAEVAASTGPFTLIPPTATTITSVRMNGGAVRSVTNTVAATDPNSPATMVGTITSGSITGLQTLTDQTSGATVGATGALVSGGVNRGCLTGLDGGGATLLVSAGTGANDIVITLGTSVAWATTPVVGDTLCIADDAADYGAVAPSVIRGATGVIAGAYVVTAATATTVSATKLRDATGTAPTSPAADLPTLAISTSANEDDFMCFSPVTIKNQTGTNRGVLNTALVTAGDLTGTVSSGVLTVTLTAGSPNQWAATPQPGDWIYFPSTAPAAISNAVGGWWLVNSATSTTILMTKLSNGATTAFGATGIAAVTDMICIRPAIDGLGKTMEIQDGGGAQSIATVNPFYQLNTTNVTWVSTLASPKLLRSASERELELSVLRNSDSVNETINAGGDIVMKVGYQGTTATLTISATTISTTVVGGSGANFSYSLSGYRTVADLVAKINAQPGYTAVVGTAATGQFPVTALDEGTWSICSTQAQVVSGIKKDGYDFFNQVDSESFNVQLGATTATNIPAISGLPDSVTTTFLAGGAKGATTAAAALAGIDACEKIRGNFLVTLFSRDATEDITDALTDSGSTYLIDAINAYVVTHCVKMSQLKRRRPRQGFTSFRGSFADAKEAAANLASARACMAFQDVKAVGSDGTITQFQPWYGAALAAGYQAAAFYRPIFNKGLNCSGVIQDAGDFVDSDDSAVEDALQSGLLVIRARDTGGFSFVSDQTTYTFDSNFVYNSIQAVYVADTLSQTIAQRMERAFVGQSLADVSAALVLSYLKGIMSDLRRLKLIVGDDDAPEGYKNAVVQIAGGAIAISVAVKEATGVYFVVIKALVQQVQQTATA